MNEIKPAPRTSHTFGDSLSILGIALALLMWVLVPTIAWKFVAVMVGAILISYLVYRSHFTRTWKPSVKHVVGAGSLLVILVGGGLQLWSQWKSENPVKPLASTAAEASRPTNEGKSGVLAPTATKAGQPAQANVIGACHLDADGSPCELICSASNPSSQLAAHDVAMGFNRLIPIKTGVSASPEDRVRLEQSDTLPVQNANGSFPDFRAFAIIIPLIPPASKVEFTVWTNDIGNKKACVEQQLIQNHRRKVMAAYFAAVSKRQPTVKTPDVDQLLLVDAKMANLFHPDIIESDRGKQRVEFITRADEKTAQVALSVYKLLPNYPDVLAPEKKWECMAPVYQVEQTGGGTTTFSELVPLAHVYVESQFLIDTQKTGTMQKKSPKQPESYICSP